MSDGYYDVAQICENGHIVNSMAHDYPNSNQDYCDKCGAPTIMACPSCETAIRGFFHDPMGLGFSYAAPAFCYNCGNPFPWTTTRLRAAEDLADELDDLAPNDRESLKKSLHDLVRETPKTRLAETRFKKIMRKVGRDGYDGMKALLSDIVSDVVRKTIFGPS
jgi:hypothetical protein